LSAGLKAAFDDFNATSGLSVKLKLIQADDPFQPDKALTATRQLIQQDHVAALTTTIGDPSVLAIRPLLNQQCVPLISGATSLLSTTDVAKYPWTTTTTTLSSAVEAKIWLANATEKYPNRAKIGIFYSDDASGHGSLLCCAQFTGNHVAVKRRPCSHGRTDRCCLHRSHEDGRSSAAQTT
jgi:ABC-type branched-subunit amino acid transport system substrate-binding protein